MNDPQDPAGRSTSLTFLMVLAGLVLLLPGVCALYFIKTSHSILDESPLVPLWLGCFAISAVGIALIRRAVKRPGG